MFEPISEERGERSVAYPPEKMVGRIDEQQAICKAIEDEKQVVYVEGGGGIGKTRLLTEAPRFIDDVVSDCSPVVLTVIDFYDTAMHSSVALEDALVRRIRKQSDDPNLFQDFLQLLEHHRAGRVGEQKVHEEFTQSFNRWAKGRYAVFCFDTAEALEYGRDAQEVINDCELKGMEAPAVQWIQNNLRDLNNVTLLIAGRPTLDLREQLKKDYTGDAWEDICLNTLSPEETYQYFMDSPYGRDVDKETIERIWLLTNGRPILLSLAIDWLHREVELQEIYKDDLEKLYDLRENQCMEWQSRREKFESDLIRKIRLLSSPMDAAVYYAARARKGFTAWMLHQILTDGKEDLPPKKIEITLEEAQNLVDSLADLSFVKHPYGAREGWYFLHDEMYDLLDKYVWRDDYPGYTHQAKTAKFLAERIYGVEDSGGLITDAAKDVSEAGPHLELLETRRHLNILKTERLFYMLEANPQKGYQHYQNLDIQAIDQGNREWDDILRIEFLRFLNTFSYWAKQGGLVEKVNRDGNAQIFADFVNQDARALWIHRFLAREEYRKAIRIANKLLEKYPDWRDFWKAIVLVGLGSALVRLGEDESARVLRQAIQILEDDDLDGYLWAIRHYTGMAYLYLGLRSRAEWDLKQAAVMYEKANETFQNNGEEIAAARALNNSAFILVKQGEYQKAIDNVREAVAMRDELGDVVGKGLSLNTLAIAIDRSGQPVNAWRYAWDALRHLQLAKESGYPGVDRAIAMVLINLGRIQRHRARRDRPHREERVMENWQRSEKFLLRAETLVNKLDMEPYYQFDLYNQFGLLYSNWANWIFTRSSQEKEQFFELMKKGSHYFRKADEFAKENKLFIDQADNLEDWAWVYHLRRAYGEETGEVKSPEELRRKVFELLDRAETLALGSIDDISQKGLQAYYTLGCVHHQRGRFIYKFDLNDRNRNALKEYALSVGYYDHFALNPSDPLERRERVREHIRYTLEDLLQKASEEEVEKVCDEMIQVVKDEDLPSTDLRRWLESVLVDLTWDQGGIYG